MSTMLRKTLSLLIAAIIVLSSPAAFAAGNCAIYRSWST